MRIMRRLLSVFTAFTLVLICCFSAGNIIHLPSANAAAAQGPTVSVSTVNGQAGESVNVAVNLLNNPGLAVLRLKVSYPGNSLTLNSVSDGGILGEHMFSSSKSSPYILYWTNPISLTDYTDSGVLATLNFTISSTVENGALPVNISLETENDALNKDLGAVALTLESGLIVVGDEPAPPVAAVEFTKTYDFKNENVKNAYSDADEWVLTYSKANGDDPAKAAWHRGLTGFTTSGLSLASASPLNSEYGWHEYQARAILRGPVDVNTNATGGIDLKEGWTYTITVKSAIISTEGWVDARAITVGQANNSNRQVKRLSGAPITAEYDCAKYCWRPAVCKNESGAYNAGDSSAPKGLDQWEAAFKSEVPLTNSKWQDYTFTYTAKASDEGTQLCIMTGTAKSGLSIYSPSTWILNQRMIDSVVVKAVPPKPVNVTYDQNGYESQGEIIGGKVTLPGFVDSQQFIYWSAEAGGVYFPGEIVASKEGDKFIAHSINRATGPNYSIADGETEYGNAALSGIRFKGSVPAATIEAATSVSFKVMPKIAVTSAAAPADWYVDGKYIYTLDKDIENFKTEYYEKTASEYTYQLCIRKLSTAQMAADFMVVIEVVGEGGTEYFYVGCQDFETVKSETLQ